MHNPASTPSSPHPFHTLAHFPFHKSVTCGQDLEEEVSALGPVLPVVEPPAGLPAQPPALPPAGLPAQPPAQAPAGFPGLALALALDWAPPVQNRQAAVAAPAAIAASGATVYYPDLDTFLASRRNLENLENALGSGLLPNNQIVSVFVENAIGGKLLLLRPTWSVFVR